VRTSEFVHGAIQYVSKHVTTHPATRQTKEILDFLNCAEEALEWRPPTVYTMYSITTTSVVPPTCFSQAALQSGRTRTYKIQVRSYLRLDNNHKCCSSYMFRPDCTTVRENTYL